MTQFLRYFPKGGSRLLTSFLLIISLFSVKAYTQLQESGIPHGLILPQLSDHIPTKVLPTLDRAVLALEDEEDQQNNVPPRFGFPFDVNFNLDNAGEWTTLENGDRMWQLKLYCPEALSVNLNYSRFWLPEGAKMYVYGASGEHITGAFTSRNNKGTKADMKGFATGLVYDDEIIVEYYEPAAVAGEGVIDIAQVVHGYRFIRIPEQFQDPDAPQVENFGNSGACQVNINCPEGLNWQDEKKSVAVMIINGFRVCTGFLINNTAQDGTPLFMTADHCIGNMDAQGANYGPGHTFMWNYESPGCNSVDVSTVTTTGALLLANDYDTDFALFLLQEDPREAGADVYYSGWNRSDNVGQGGVGIHHPQGDVMKIGTYHTAPVTETFRGGQNVWRIDWVATANGYSVTEGGSSGSPLYDSNGLVIGQLYGSQGLNCQDPSTEWSHYGKFSVSWDGRQNAPTRRLRDWLHPYGGTAPMTLNGGYIPLGGAGQRYVGETGQVTVSQSNRNQWHTVHTSGFYVNPVVVMGPVSHNGGDPSVARVRNVTATSFEFQIAEWEYLDGAHTSETISYMVMEEGEWTLPGGQKAKAASVNNVTHKWTTLNPGNLFSTRPVVLSQGQTSNGSEIYTVRMNIPNKTKFKFRTREQEVNKQKHAAETIGYIAIEPGKYTNGITYEVKRTGVAYDHQWDQVEFDYGNYSASSIFLAGLQTYKGKEPCVLRCENLDDDEVEVFVEEERSKDTEMSTVNEAVGFVLFRDAGVISGVPAKGASKPANGTQSGTGIGADVELVEAAPAFEGIQVYPNPATNWFEVNWNLEGDGAVSYRLTDLQGRMVRSLEQHAEGMMGNFRVEVADLPAGIYVLEVRRGNVVERAKLSIR